MVQFVKEGPLIHPKEELRKGERRVKINGISKARKRSLEKLANVLLEQERLNSVDTSQDEASIEEEEQERKRQELLTGYPTTLEAACAQARARIGKAVKIDKSRIGKCSGKSKGFFAFMEKSTNVDVNKIGTKAPSKPRYDVTDPRYKPTRLAESTRGRERIEQFRKTVESLEALDKYADGSICRYPDQYEACMSMLAAAAIYILEDDLNIFQEEVSNLIGQSIFKRFLLLLTPRQWGKSETVARFMAAMILNVPKTSIGIFAQNEDKAQDLLHRSQAYIDILTTIYPNHGLVILKKNTNCIVLQEAGKPHSTKRQLCANSSSPKGKQMFFFLV